MASSRWLRRNWRTFELHEVLGALAVLAALAIVTGVVIAAIF